MIPSYGIVRRSLDVPLSTVCEVKADKKSTSRTCCSYKRCTQYASISTHAVTRTASSSAVRSNVNLRIGSVVHPAPSCADPQTKEKSSRSGNSTAVTSDPLTAAHYARFGVLYTAGQDGLSVNVALTPLALLLLVFLLQNLLVLVRGLR